MKRSSMAGILAVVLCLSWVGVLMAQDEPTPTAQTSEEVAIAAENATAEMAAQETTTAVSPQEATAAASAQEPASASVTGPDTKVPEWVWGEVTSVDKDNAQFEIKHLDYETYEEVTKTIKVNEKTLFENAANVSDLKIGDKVTIDYTTKDGAAFAELVVLEKETATGVSEAGDEPVAPAEDVADLPEAGSTASSPAASVEAPASSEAPVSSASTSAPASSEAPAVANVPAAPAA